MVVGQRGLMLTVLALAGAPANRRAALLLPVLAALGAGCLGLWGELMRTHARYAGEWLWAVALAGLNLWCWPMPHWPWRVGTAGASGCSPGSSSMPARGCWRPGSPQR